jgi:dimethylargininase
MKLGAPALALVRPVSVAYTACLRAERSASIDVAAARRQHAAYVEALQAAGVKIEWVSGEKQHDSADAEFDLPDSCFVEDTAVILGRDAVLTVPGAPQRQAETAAVADSLSRHCQLFRMTGEARLDGGDVLRVGHTLFVGRSARTNDAGIDFLAKAAEKSGLSICAVPVQKGLHLKSACTLAGESTVIAAAPLMPAELADALRARGIAIVETPEDHGGNVLALGAFVLVSAAAPRTAQALRARGCDVKVIDVGEIHKGDGALTCLSLRIPKPGSYCA